MNRYILGGTTAMLIVVGCAFLMAGEGGRQDGRGGFLGQLSVGDQVILKDLGSAYEIQTFPGVPGTHTVSRIGTDYVTFDLQGQAIRTTVPIYSIKALVEHPGAR